eukprot:gene9186-11260_t
MDSRGYFRGTSAEQDNRFSDKEKKHLKTMKFPSHFNQKVDTDKVHLPTFKKYITKQIESILTYEDEVVIDYIYGLLENRHPDPKIIQINITGFLEDNAAEFMSNLWALLLSAQNSIGGIPEEFLKDAELMASKSEQEENRIKEAIDKTKIKIEKANGTKNNNVSYGLNAKQQQQGDSNNNHVIEKVLIDNTTSSKFDQHPENTTEQSPPMKPDQLDIRNRDLKRDLKRDRAVVDRDSKERDRERDRDYERSRKYREDSRERDRYTRGEYDRDRDRDRDYYYSRDRDRDRDYYDSRDRDRDRDRDYDRDRRYRDDSRERYREKTSSRYSSRDYDSKDRESYDYRSRYSSSSSGSSSRDKDRDYDYRKSDRYEDERKSKSKYTEDELHDSKKRRQDEYDD